MSRTHHPRGKLPKREREGYLSFGLKAVPLLETLLLSLALYQLGFADGGIGGWLKLAIFGMAAYLVSYIIYRMAIEKAATLLSVGYKAAGVLGGLSVLLVGIAFFIATAAGLTIASVEEQRLTAYLETKTAYVEARGAQVAGAARLAPVISTIADDQDAKAACEKESSCVSGRGSGGYGSTSRMLETLAARARGIADQINAGLAKRAELQTELSDLMAQMNETLADEKANIWTRRAELRGLDGALGSLLARLDEAVPSTLVTSYAQELRAGIAIPNRPQVSNTINRFLTGYADTIEAALAEVTGEPPVRPNFPVKTGALDTFAHAAKFAPVFLLAFLIDVLFPIALWAYTVWGLDWEKENESPDPNRGKRQRTDLDDLTELKAVQLLRSDDGGLEGREANNPPQGSPSPRSPRRKTGR